MKKQTILNLGLCSAMHGLNHYLLIFYKPMYSSIGNYFQLNTVSGITTRMTIIYAGYAISNFISGLLVKRIGFKLMLFLGMLLMSLAAFLVYFVPSHSYFVMVSLIFLMGLGGGTYHPAANTLATASFEGKAGQAIGILSIGSAIGFVMAPFIGEYIGAKGIGFQTLFLISGIAGIVFSLVFLLFAQDHQLVEEKAANNQNNSSSIPKGKVLALAIALLCIPVTIRELAGWSFYEITPFWVKYGFSKGITVSLVQSMQYLPGLLVQPFTGKLCDKLGTKKILVINFIILGLGLILFSFSNIIILWFAMFLFGIGMSSSTVSSETYIAQLVTSKNRALVYGIVLSFGLGIGGMLAGVSGLVVDIFGREVATGYRVWYFSCGAALILSIFVYSIIERLKKARLEEEHHL
jgi:MFS family permease